MFEKLLPEDLTLDKSRDLRLNDEWFVIGDINEVTILRLSVFHKSAFAVQ